MTAAGNSGNAASRVESFIQSKGAYAYGGYPDIDELFQQQARERDPTKREALLHKIQQLTIDRVMFAPIMDLRALIGRRPAHRQAHDHRRLDEPVPVLRGHGAQAVEPLPSAASNSGRRSLPPNIRSPWKKVGTPNAPRAPA